MSRRAASIDTSPGACHAMVAPLSSMSKRPVAAASLLLPGLALGRGLGGGGGRVGVDGHQAGPAAAPPPATTGATLAGGAGPGPGLGVAVGRLRVVAEEAAKLAHVVSIVTAVLDPGLIVLTGGIGRNADLLAEPIRRELAETIPVVPDIVGGQLGEDAVLVGAIATAMDTAWDLVFDRRVRRTASEA